MLYQSSSQVIKVQYGAVTEEVVSYHEQDVCPDKDQVENLAQVTTKVLPSTLTMGWRNAWDFGSIPRETLPEIRKYTKKVLEEMQGPNVSRSLTGQLKG